MRTSGRRPFLSAVASMLTTGCLSQSSADEQESESNSGSDGSPLTRTTTRTPTPIDGEQGLSVTNYSAREITFRLVITEYTDEIGDAEANEIEPATATPESGGGKERTNTEMTVSSDEHTAVDDVFTVEGTPRKYYVVVDADEFGKERATFTLEKGGHFRYVSLTFSPEPEINIVFR